MRLKRMVMNAFGKFKEKEINLDDGLNLICGENESGKSTIHRFIRGMLFGFKHEGRRRRYYTVEMDQYRPWFGNDYSGSLEYEKEDGQRIRIERNFDRDQTRIFDVLTGKSLLADYGMDPRREYQFAQDHLGLNATVFDNTIFLAQLGGKTGKELAAEVAGRLASLSSSGREDMSLRQAVDELKKKKEEVGTVKAATRPLGKAVRRGDELAQERQETLELYESIRKQQEENAALETHRKDLKQERTALRKRMEKAQRMQDYQDGERIRNLWQQREEAQAQMDRNAAFSRFPDHLRDELGERLTRLETLGGSIRRLHSQLASWSEKEQNLKMEILAFPEGIAYGEEARRRIAQRWTRQQSEHERLVEIQSSLASEKERRDRIQDSLSGRSHLEELVDAIDQLEENEEQKKILLMSTLPKERADAEKEQLQRQRWIRQRNRLVWLFVLMMLTGAGWFMSQDLIPAAAGLVAASLGMVGLGQQTVRKAKAREKEAQRSLQGLIEQEEENRKQLLMIDQIRDLALSRSGADQLRSARQLVDEYRRDQERVLQLEKDIGEREQEVWGKRVFLQKEEQELTMAVSRLLPSLERLSEDSLEIYLDRLESHQHRQLQYQQVVQAREVCQKDLDDLEMQKNELVASRDGFLQQAGVTDWKSFQEGCGRKEQYLDALRKRDQADELLEPFFKQRSWTQWQEHLQSYPLLSDDLQSHPENLDELKKGEDDLSQRLHNLDVRIAAITADMGRAMEGRREPARIEEEYAAACREREIWEDRAAALELALEVLEAAAEKRHRLLAPELNRRVGEMVSHLTAGRYRKVLIDEELTITVSAPEGGRQVDLSTLSAGTIDQFYFAVRVAISDLLSQDRKLPLFLDDPFVQYSSRRLKQVLLLLGELAADRQILLFTCREQEQDRLDALGIPYHRISLE